MDNSSSTPVNLSEMESDLVLQVPMPGAEPENILIRISDSGDIAVQATPRGSRAPSAKWYIHEWQVGDYERRVNLPHAIDSERANATYRNGVLSVSMPRGNKTTNREIRLQPIASAYGEEVGHRGHSKQVQ